MNSKADMRVALYIRFTFEEEPHRERERERAYKPEI